MEKKLQEIMIKKAGKEIYTLVYTPLYNEGDKMPVIIFSHGYNGTADDFKMESEFMSDKGFVAVSYDFCGGSNRSRSSGTGLEMSLLSEVDDLNAVLDYVAALDFVDSKRIFLMGGSQGGMVTLLAVQNLNDRIDKIFLYYPALCIPRDWKERYPDLNKLPEKVELWEHSIGPEFIRCAHKIDLDTMLNSYTGEIYIYHGDKDEVVSLSFSEDFCAQHSNARLEVLKDEKHGFTEEANKRLINKIYEIIA